MNRKIIIWGCGGLGREVLMICKSLNLEVAGFLDERQEMKDQLVYGIPVLGDIDNVVKDISEYEITFGVADPALRRRFYEKSIKAGFKISKALIHPSVLFSDSIINIGNGSVLCQGSMIMVNVKMGECCVVNQLCSIGHDLVSGSFVTISPCVAVSGNIIIEDDVFIGTGSAIKEKITIGARSVIAGGAFVNRNVPNDVMVAGVPAEVKKMLS